MLTGFRDQVASPPPQYPPDIKVAYPRDTKSAYEVGYYTHDSTVSERALWVSALED